MVIKAAYTVAKQSMYIDTWVFVCVYSRFRAWTLTANRFCLFLAPNCQTEVANKYSNTFLLIDMRQMNVYETKLNDSLNWVHIQWTALKLKFLITFERVYNVFFQTLIAFLFFQQALNCNSKMTPRQKSGNILFKPIQMLTWWLIAVFIARAVIHTSAPLHRLKRSFACIPCCVWLNVWNVIDFTTAANLKRVKMAANYIAVGVVKVRQPNLLHILQISTKKIF